MSLNPSQLNYFVHVAEAGQITLAARTLHIAQPALSQAISRLECQLGVELLERHPRGVALTPAGEIFLEKARAALRAEADAVATARSLARSDNGTLEVGFLGAPPPLIAARLLDAFAAAHPGIEISFRELRFPTSPTVRWLSDVDAVLCYAPTSDPEVDVQTLWHEPRTALLHRTHPLATRRALCVEDVLEEEFYGHHPSVDPTWAAFWSLDDHRRAPPSRTTNDRPANALELVAAMASGRAIRTLPASLAAMIVGVLPELVAHPLRDAAPARYALAWRAPLHNPLVESLVQIASELDEVDAQAAPPQDFAVRA